MPEQPENNQATEVSELQARLARAEAELAVCRRNEEHFRRLAENSIDLILLTTPEGQITYVSPAAKRLLDIDPETLVGRMSYELILPEDMPIATEAHMAALMGAAPRPTVYRVRNQAGAPVWLEVIKMIVPNPKTGAIQVQSISRDVSERMAIERMKDQFLGILSHELRTPINAIMGFGSVLDDEIVGPLNERQKGFTRKLLHGAEQLLALVNDLLDMSRIQAGKFSITPAPMRVSEVLERTLPALALLSSQRGLRLESELAPDLPVLTADVQRVSQVVANLLTNAIKFTPEGGTITVRATLKGASVRLEVQDTGIGIAAEDLDKLFVPFSQLDMSSTRSVRGDGLGLSITKALVEAHGGALGVESVPAVGSTFWFDLPLVSPLTPDPLETPEPIA
jgi:PAS domain S-box-containing protein